MFAVWLSACAGSGAPPESSPAHDAVSHEPSASAAATAPASVDPMAACAGVEPDGEPFEVVIETVSYAFDTELIEGPTHCQPFVITFTNNDTEANEITTNQHDVDIRADNVLGALLFDGELVAGGGSIRYEVPGLPAGEQYFYCSQHAGNMNGTLIVAEQ
jgi:plastocyanin